MHQQFTHLIRITHARPCCRTDWPAFAAQCIFMAFVLGTVRRAWRGLADGTQIRLGRP